MKVQQYTIITLLCAHIVSSITYGTTNNVIVSWGDSSVVYGPGTDSAMDSPEGIRRLIERWIGRGFTGLYLRTDLVHGDPNQLIYHPTENVNPMVALALKRGVDDVVERFNVAVTARQIAESLGFEYCMYHPTVYSSGAPASTGWTCEYKFLYDHPEWLTVDRAGKKQYMVPEYAYAGARAAKIAEFIYLYDKFGVVSMIPSMRTEAGQIPNNTPVKADQYGFNQIIVDEMQSRYGIDIRTDPRFDIYNPSFSPSDPLVQKWHDLRGEYLTQFFRELRVATKARNSNIKIIAQIPGDYVGPELGNWRVDWRKWVDEGLVDTIVQSSSLAAGFESTVGRGYLNDVFQGIGILPTSVYRDYIDDSNHPEIKLIQTGGWEYFPLPLPSGADGWQTFWTVEAFDLAWFQRWKQWKKDLVDMGYIKYFEQNFDSFPIYSKANNGSEGDARYHPDLRACPGGWYLLGDGNDSKATVQNLVRNGTMGNALRISGDPSGYSAVWARHISGVDRSTAQSSIDNVIVNGTMRFEFWAYRPDSLSSLSTYIQYDLQPESRVGLIINASTGAVYLPRGGGTTFTGYYLPQGVWQKFVLDVNLETRTYSCYAGANSELVLKTNVSYTVSQNRFNQLYLISSSPAGTVVYVDDFSLKWYPKMSYAPQNKYCYLTDDFEKHNVNSIIEGKMPQHGYAWQCSDSVTNFYIENDLSFGTGYKCLAAKKSGLAAVFSNSDSKLQLEPNNVVTLDFDIYLKNGYSTIAGLTRSADEPFTAAVYPDSNWKCWNGTQHIDSGISVDYGAWNHVQLALNCSTRTYNVVVQSVGSMPILIGSFAWDPATAINSSVFFQIKPQGQDGQIVYFDNVQITYGMPNACGSEYHPSPVGDFNTDCSVDYKDLGIFASHWLENSMPE